MVIGSILVECLEKVENVKKGTIEPLNEVHLTDLFLERSIAVKVSQGGRLRFQAENEGFNTQKNQGYNLKHK